MEKSVFVTGLKSQGFWGADGSFIPSTSTVSQVVSAMSPCVVKGCLTDRDLISQPKPEPTGPDFASYFMRPLVASSPVIDDMSRTTQYTRESDKYIDPRSFDQAAYMFQAETIRTDFGGITLPDVRNGVNTRIDNKQYKQ